MLMIRLQRVGRKHDPSYRVVVTEHTRGPKSNDYVEVVGNYDPRKPKAEAAVLKDDRVKYWLSVGAQVSDTVHNILVAKGLVSGKKIAVHSTKNTGKEEEEKAEEATTDDSAADESKEEEKKEEAPAEPEEKEGE